MAMRSVFARIHNVLAWLAVVGSVVQFFLIALAYFGGTNTGVHALSGRILMAGALLMLIAAVAARAGRRTIVTSLVVFLLLFPIQGVLAYLDLPPALNALHAVTGTAILYLSYALANGWARVEVPAMQRQPAAAD